MKVVIIDDEAKARELLKNILIEKCDCSSEQIFEASNLKEGVEQINSSQPRLVFLDIEMPDEQGIELFKYFEKETISFEIIFTTAYSQYALQAFEMKALDYLLKPIRPTKVSEIVSKIRESQDRDNIDEKFRELKEALTKVNFNKIGLPSSDGIHFVPMEEIIHLEADGMYTNIYTSNGKEFVVSKPLKYFSNLVESSNYFYRPHRSHIFNFKYLKQYVRKKGNYIVLENDQILPISKDKREEFLEIISEL